MGEIEKETTYEAFSPATHGYNLLVDIDREVAAAKQRGYYLSQFYTVHSNSVYPVFGMEFSDREGEWRYEIRVLDIIEFYSFADLNSYLRDNVLTQPQWGETFFVNEKFPILYITFENVSDSSQATEETPQTEEQPV